MVWQNFYKENLISPQTCCSPLHTYFGANSMAANNIYHISENGGITSFKPRPSPSLFEGLTKDVFFGIEEKLLHNYLLPRDCPRVTFYAGENTSSEDRKLFLHTASAAYIVITEAGWLPVIEQTTLYCYEFDAAPFTLLDECAGYYVAYTEVKPVGIRRIDNILQQLTSLPHVELRIVPNLWAVAERVKASTLQFSLIRMRNAKSR